MRPAQAGRRAHRNEERLVRQGSVWYDNCPVCQGRGAIPCGACSGIGQISHAEHLPSEVQVGGGGGRAAEQATVATCCACPACDGKGEVSCTACHGHGIRKFPVYAGTYY